ncbi:MAG TPA: molybdopterin-dependent oxidoreductase [Gaiellales bacterium]|nr:molybdopterin-dependent oxidoreductase [Gaiellales bacterium]
MPEPHVQPGSGAAAPQSPAPEVHNTAARLEALGAATMPAAEHFRREHFPAPDVDRHGWRLVLGGLVETPAILALADLAALPARTLPVVLECAGHRRAELAPAVPGLQWEVGAVSEARWTGARLRDLLERSGADPRATGVVLTGADRGPFEGDGGRHPYGRSLPLRKAIDPDTLLAYEMDGAPIPAVHGGPVRAIVPGWYATDSVKWLERIQVTAEEFGGPFQAIEYRFAAADDPGPGERMERVPVHSLVTDPAPGTALDPGPATVRGIAWSGGGAITRVEVQVDGGEWQRPAVTGRSGLYGRTRFEHPFTAEPGRHTIAARARDAAGGTQPEEPVWNRGGYRNNAVHRITVTVRERR